MWYLASWHQHPWPAELRCWKHHLRRGRRLEFPQDGRRLEVQVFEVFESPSHRNLRKLIVCMYYVLLFYISSCTICLHIQLYIMFELFPRSFNTDNKWRLVRVLQRWQPGRSHWPPGEHMQTLIFLQSFLGHQVQISEQMPKILSES